MLVVLLFKVGYRKGKVYEIKKVKRWEVVCILERGLEMEKIS
jgi:hypothetical protein